MKSKKFLFAVVALVIAAGAIYFFGETRPKIKNVLLISIDTIRADYLSCYGYGRKTTPFIDSFAAEGVLFENAFCHIPLTLPSHCSMLTGTIPPYHGVHDNVEYQLGESNITLAEILKENGFKTAAVISSFVIDSQFGLDQGFDYYNDEFVEEISGGGHFTERRGQETTDFANKWLGETGQEKFFMFVHYYDPHTDYDAPEPFGSKFSSQFDIGVDKLRNNYAEEILYTDHCIKQVVDKLKEIGQYDSTLIIITGDHGEMFGEHMEMSHGYFVYRNVLRIPLIFKLPGKKKPVRVKDNCGLMDIVPTICDLLDIEVPKAVQGKSLTSYFKNGASSDEKRSIFCESLTPTTLSANSLLSVINDKWQYIQTTRPELYNLVNDPYERNDLIAKESQRARILQDSLREILESSVKSENNSSLEINDEARKKLESLGYIQGGTSIDESFEFDQSKPDPKDYIDLFNERLQIRSLILEEEYEKAREICLRMIEEYPGVVFVYHAISDIATRQEKFTEAEKYLRKATELDPDNYKSYNRLGVALARQGNYEEAVVQYKKALAIEPDDLDANREMGIALAHIKNYAGAVKYLKKAVEMDPEIAMLNAALAEALFYLNDVELAIMYWEKSLEYDPEDTKVQEQLADAKKVNERFAAAAAKNKIAESYLAQGDIASAVENWKKALEINDKWPGVLNNLAWILATSKDENIRNAQEAIEYGKKACELTEYKNAELLDSLAAAYAATGNFDKAIEIAEKAINVAINLGFDKNAEQARKHLNMYKNGKAIYE
jgi:arylsulfatase A-like enzyme/Flp pilus assembly protein TadD